MEEEPKELDASSQPPIWWETDWVRPGPARSVMFQ
jgi:hypothetical protein